MEYISPETLIRTAKDGDRTAVAQLLERYRPYLSLLARLQRDCQFHAGVELQSKIDDSDLIQEVSVSASRHFHQFRGETEADFASWLRSIMAHATAECVRHYTRQRRDVRIEQSLQSNLDQSSQMIAEALPSPEPSPSEHAAKRELAVVVADALAQLPSHYREVIILRDFEGLSLIEVAQRMGRSRDSVQKLWARAVLLLQRSMEGHV